MIQTLFWKWKFELVFMSKGVSFFLGSSLVSPLSLVLVDYKRFFSTYSFLRSLLDLPISMRFRLVPPATILNCYFSRRDSLKISIFLASLSLYLKSTSLTIYFIVKITAEIKGSVSFWSLLRIIEYYTRYYRSRK